MDRAGRLVPGERVDTLVEGEIGLDGVAGALTAILAGQVRGGCWCDPGVTARRAASRLRRRSPRVGWSRGNSGTRRRAPRGSASSVLVVLVVLVVLLVDGQHDALGVHEVVGDVERRIGPHGDGHGVRRAGRRPAPPGRPGAGRSRRSRCRTEFGHDHPEDLGPERLEEVPDEVVGHRPRRVHALKGEGDGRRLRCPDEDGQGATEPLRLLEQQHRRVRLEVHPNRTEPHLDHAAKLTRHGAGLRRRRGPGCPAAAADGVGVSRSAARAGRARAAAAPSCWPSRASSSAVWPARARASGLRWRTKGMTICSTNPASRSAAFL